MVENNARILRVTSIAINVILKKAGISVQEINEAIAEEIKRSSQQVPVQPSGAGTDGGDFGKREPGLLYPEGERAPEGSPESKSSGRSPENPDGDKSPSDSVDGTPSGAEAAEA